MKRVIDNILQIIKIIFLLIATFCVALITYWPILCFILILANFISFISVYFGVIFGCVSFAFFIIFIIINLSR